MLLLLIIFLIYRRIPIINYCLNYIIIEFEF